MRMSIQKELTHLVNPIRRYPCFPLFQYISATLYYSLLCQPDPLVNIIKYCANKCWRDILLYVHLQLRQQWPFGEIDAKVELGRKGEIQEVGGGTLKTNLQYVNTSWHNCNKFNKRILALTVTFMLQIV